LGINHKFKLQQDTLAGCGTQTAALAFGGYYQLIQEQQKNMMEHLGQQSGTMNTVRTISRSRNSNSSFSFWWSSRYIKQQQKNMMVLVGQHLQVCQQEEIV
jgi:hypothetical protein